jgi:hypothetical protein
MKIFTAFAIAIVLLLPSLAKAHGGGLNKDGCHNNRKTGESQYPTLFKTPTLSTVSEDCLV